MKPKLNIYWSRRDLRLKDNLALLAATEACKLGDVPFLPLFILEDYMTAAKPESQFGYPQRYFLAQALPLFAKNFTNFALVKGKAAQYLIKLSTSYDLTIFVNDDVYVDFYAQVNKLKAAGIKVEVLEDALTISKDTRSGGGDVYSIFSPFKRMVWTSFTAKRTLNIPKLDDLHYFEGDLLQSVEISTEAIWSEFSKNRKISVANWVLNLDDLLPLPKLEGWYWCEKDALARFEYFLESEELDRYDQNRNSLELDANTGESDGHAYSSQTSKMSLALAWGLVSARTLVRMMQDYYSESFDNPMSSRVSVGALTYISELIWREFYRYQLFHRPELMNQEFQKRFQGTINWVEDTVARERFLAWIKGETGYPIVDAAMKQLAETGWMHNRSRMIVASILTKNLGVDWRWGQEYFRAVLIDLDEASNNGGWQWGASVGTDPKPIRIFNPDLQAKNYDTSGAYQKRWLENGEFILGAPTVPIVEHKVARNEALKRYGLSKEE